MTKYTLLLLSIVPTLIACGANQTETVKLGDYKYQIPQRDIVSVILDIPMYHIDIIGSDKSYRLIYSSKNERRNKTGNGAPTIAFVNDSRFTSSKLVKNTNETVVCDTSEGATNCGFILYKNGIKWAVIFERRTIPRIPEVRSLAIRQIDGYRRKAVQAVTY